jgi:hypothetical protein
VERPRRHRREIGQVDPQQFAGDWIGRVLGQIVHAFDDCISGNDKPVPGAAIDQCRVIQQVESARPGERRKKAPDALELAHWTLRHASGHLC